MKLKILFISQYFYPEHFSNNNIVEFLVSRGHKVKVIAATPNYPRGEIYPGYGFFTRWQEKVFGADIVRVPTIPRGKSGLGIALNFFTYALSASIYAAVDLFRFRPDVVFASEPSPITIALPAIVSGHLGRRPVILWTQDLWPESVEALVDMDSGVPQRLVGRVVAMLSAAIYRRVDVIFSPSHQFAPRLHARAPKVPVVYWPNTTEPDVVPIAPDPGRRNALGIGEDHICLAYAGNIGEAQNPLVMAKAAAKLTDLPVTFLVMGDGRANADLHAEISRLGVAGRFVFTGQLPVGEVAANLAAADAALVTLRDAPAFSLTVPYRLQSFLASGKPVLSCGGEAVGEIIADAGCGFASPPDDAVAFAAAIRRFAALTPVDRVHMGTNALAYSHAHFSREKVFGDLERLLQLIATRQTLPPEALI